MTLTYFPGCTLHRRARGFDLSARWAAQALGIELEELPEWQCCGGLIPQIEDGLMGLVAPVRILADARPHGDRLLTLCSFCYNTLKRANRIVREDEEKRRTLTDFLEQPYDGGVEVVHLLEILRDEVGFGEVKKRVQRPLTDWRVVPYYGCLLLRPHRDLGLDDPEEPTILERFLESLGCEVLDFPRKTECCGSFLILSHPDVAAACSSALLQAVASLRADALVTSCPLCQYNLDRQQAQMLGKDAGFQPIPVLYFTQLLALALGSDPDRLGLEQHFIDPTPLVMSKGAK
jgi:heterodisulfide reductase subunit B